MTKIESTKCNKCISRGGGDCATCDPEMCKSCLPDYRRVGCSCLDMHDAAIAAKAREEVLKLMWVELQSCGISKEVFNAISLNIHAKSLRTTTEEKR